VELEIPWVSFFTFDVPPNGVREHCSNLQKGLLQVPGNKKDISL
jgi:hypothetical protein